MRTRFENCLDEINETEILKVQRGGSGQSAVPQDPQRSGVSSTITTQASAHPTPKMK